MIAVAVGLIVGLVAIGSRTSSGGGQPVVVTIATPTFGGYGSTGPTGGSGSGAAASLGQSRTLNGSIAGEKVRVRFTRWVDDARANSSIFAAGPGKRYVAAQFRIANTGSAEYVDSPFNGAAVVDRAGRNYRAAFLVDGIREGRVFGATVSIPTGASATGFIVFEVPAHAKIRRVEFSESSGFGQTGEWAVSR